MLEFFPDLSGYPHEQLWYQKIQKNRWYRCLWSPLPLLLITFSESKRNHKHNQSEYEKTYFLNLYFKSQFCNCRQKTFTAVIPMHLLSKKERVCIKWQGKDLQMKNLLHSFPQGVRGSLKSIITISIYKIELHQNQARAHRMWLLGLYNGNVLIDFYKASQRFLKLGTEVDPVWWKMLARPQGRALPREKPQEVQLFLAFRTYTTKRKFWKPQVEKRYSASSFYKFLLHQISTPAENLSENSFFFWIKNNFWCRSKLPSHSSLRKHSRQKENNISGHNSTKN